MGKRKKNTFKKINIFFWTLLAAILFLTLLLKTNFDIGYVAIKVFLPVTRLILIMAGSLYLSALIEARGWSRVVASLSRPLMRLGRLSDWSGTAFTAAFLSGVAASTMLWNAYQDGKISKREMFLAALLNVGLPSYFLHLPVTFSIIVPLVQMAGLLYMGITFLAAIIRTIIVIILGRILLKNVRKDIKFNDETVREKAEKKEISQIFSLYIRKRLASIILYTVPIYFLVVLLRLEGFFEYLQSVTTHLVHPDFIPVEGISVVVFSIVAEFSAGAAAAGAMLQEGILTIKETVIALVLGNIIATPVRALRHQLPRYLGIYKPGAGILLLLTGQFLRIISVIMATGIFLTLYR